MIRVAAVVPLAVLAIVLAGCSGGDTRAGAGVAKAKPTCLDRSGWQRLANQIHAPVYCPGMKRVLFIGGIPSQTGVTLEVQPADATPASFRPHPLRRAGR